jgi:hypothetical protein
MWSATAHATDLDPKVSDTWPLWHARSYTNGSFLYINYQWGSNLQSPGTTWRNAFEYGINQWNYSGTAVIFQAGSSNASTFDTYSASDNYGGLTYPYLDASGKMTYCRITGNVYYSWSTEQYDYITGHELGHCIGLSHYPNGTNSLMYWLVQSSPTQPTVIDAAGVNQVYPYP